MALEVGTSNLSKIIHRERERIVKKKKKRKETLWLLLIKCAKQKSQFNACLRKQNRVRYTDTSLISNSNFIIKTNNYR